MIRVILSWLGWAFIAFGLLEIAYEIYVMLSVTADTANSTEQAGAEAWKYLQEARSEKFGNCLVNLALGAIMVFQQNLKSCPLQNLKQPLDRYRLHHTLSGAFYLGLKPAPIHQ